MHLSTSSSTVGIGLTSLRWAIGSAFRRTPGFRIPSGSQSSFSRFITAYASGPHSVSTNGAMFRPVPCSAFSAPSYFFTTSSTTSSMKRAYWSSAAWSLNDCVMTKWRFPSLAWPKMIASG